MFTKKTRVLSAVLTVCMLISMLTCFVVPAVAETVTPVDTSGMTNLNTLSAYPTAVGDYVITDLAGMKKLEAWTKVRRQTFDKSTIYLGADIDMEWESFGGIGHANLDNGNYAFKGSFNGNGYVIKNLYINQPDMAYVGFFNYSHNGNLSNIVIENGIVIGGQFTGSLSGMAGLGKINNCHSGAVVISDTEPNAVGGLVGAAWESGDSAYVDITIENSSFTGTVLDSGVDVTETQGIYSGLKGVKDGAIVENTGVVTLTNNITTPGCDKATAYKMNELKVKNSFWMVGADGRLAVADEQTQTRKLTINVGAKALEAFGSAGDSVELNEFVQTEGKTVTLAEGDVGSLNGSIFTFGAGNSVVYVGSNVGYGDLNTVLALFAENEAFWATKPEAAEKLAAVKAAVADSAYTDQAEADADIDALIAYYTSLTENDTVPAGYGNAEIHLTNGVTIPATTNTGFPKIGIYSESDLLAVEADERPYNADKTIYLCADLDLAGSTFYTLENLCCGFDGQGHTIKNYSAGSHGFFQSYDGAFVKNVVFDYDENVTYNTAKDVCSIVMNNYQHHLGAEYGLLKNITIRNATVSQTTTAKYANFSLLVYAIAKDVKIKIEDILIENNTINSGKTNNSMLVGRPADIGTTADFKNITIRNNKFAESSGNAYMAVEVAKNGSNWSFENILIYGNTAKNATSLFMREYFSKGTPNTLNFTNVIAFGNQTGEHMIRYREGGAFTANTLNAQNVYLDDGKVNLRLGSDGNQASNGTLADLAAVGPHVESFATNTVIGDTEDFRKGVYAYAFNRGTANGTYVKMVNGEPVFCDEAGQTRKVTINLPKAGRVVEAYGSEGETVNLAEVVGMSGMGFTADEGSVGTLNGEAFTFGAGDGSLTSDNALFKGDLDTLNALYNENPEFWAEKGVAEMLNEINGKVDTYVTQEEMNADLSALADLFVLADGDMLPVSMKTETVTLSFGKEIHLVAPTTEFGIYNEADLLAWARVSSGQGKGQTAYLCNDLNLKDSSFVTVENWNGAFDGQGHTITDYVADSYGFLQSYDGPLVRNVTFDFTEKSIAKNKKNSGIIANDSSKDAIFEGITIKNGDFLRTSTGNASSGTRIDVFGMILGQIRGNTTATIRNCVVENNTFSVTDTGYGYGMLVGQNIENATLNIENVKVIHNTFGSRGGSKGYLVGRTESTKTKPVINIDGAIIYGNEGGSYGLFGEFWSKAEDPNLYAAVDVRNVVYYNNGATRLAKYLDAGYNEAFRPIYLTGSNIYSDNGEVSYNDSFVDYIDLPDENAAGFKEGMNVKEVDAFLSGEVAYLANKGANSALFTMKNGQVDYASSDTDQVRKVTVTFTQNGKTVEFYGMEGETVDLAEKLGDAGLTFTEAAGSVGTLNGTVFTFGAGDGALTTDVMLTSDFQKLKALIEEQVAAHPEFWAAKAPGVAEDVAAFAVDLESKDQATIDQKVKELADKMKLSADDKVPATMKAVTLSLPSVGDEIVYEDPMGSTTYTEVGIYNVADLEYAAMGDNEVWGTEAGNFDFSKGYATFQTLHLMNDLDLAGSKFVRLHDTKANFDGHNHTITNFNATTTGFVAYFTGGYFKDLNFENCHTTAQVANSAFFMDCGVTAVSDITFNNCSVDNNGLSEVAFLIGNGYRNLTVNGIEIRNCAVTGDADVRGGFIMGGYEGRWDSVDTVENILIDNCQMNGANAESALIGLYKTHKDGTLTASCNITVKNLILTNNTLVGGENKLALTAKDEGSVYTANFENVVAYNNIAIENYENANGTNTNVQADAASVVETVYNANAGLEAPIFAVTGGRAVFMADGIEAPHKVTLQDGNGKAEDKAYYTDATGAVIGLTAAEVDQLAECNLVGADNGAAIVSATYTADATFTYYAEHTMQYIGDGRGHHTVSCKNGCGTSTSEACNKEGGTVSYPATEDAEGYDVHTCSLCGEWQEVTAPKVPALKTIGSVGTNNGEPIITLPVAVKNDPGLKNIVITVTYDAAKLRYKEIQFAEGNAAPSNVDTSVPGVLTVTVGNADVLTKFAETVSSDNANYAVLFKVVFDTLVTDGEDNVTVNLIADGCSNVKGLEKTVRVSAHKKGNFGLESDGTADAADAALMLRYLAGLEPGLDQMPERINAGDMNEDGEITMLDALMLLRWLSFQDPLNS